MCALHFTHPSACTHTAVSSKHTHTVNTPGGQWAAIFLQHPGSSWGFGALLKGLTSVELLKVEVGAGHSLPPPTISAGNWDSNPQPLSYKSDSLTIRPQLPCQFCLTYSVLTYSVKVNYFRIEVQCISCKTQSGSKHGLDSDKKYSHGFKWENL